MKAVASDRCKVVATSHQGDMMAGPSHECSDVAAQAARTDDHDLGRSSVRHCLSFRVPPCRTARHRTAATLCIVARTSLLSTVRNGYAAPLFISSAVTIGPDSSLLVMPAPPEAAACRAMETIEAASVLTQHLAAPPEEAMRLGLHAERYGSATAILMRKSKNLMYNRLIAWGQASTATARQLDRFVALAHAHRAEAVGVPLGPCARPARLRDWLEQRGFECGHPGAKLWRNASPLPKRTSGRGISVRVARREDAATWVDVVAQVWRAVRITASVVRGPRPSAGMAALSRPGSMANPLPQGRCSWAPWGNAP